MYRSLAISLTGSISLWYRGLDKSSVRGSNWMELPDVEFNMSGGPLYFFDATQRAALEAVSCAWRGPSADTGCVSPIGHSPAVAVLA